MRGKAVCTREMGLGSRGSDGQGADFAKSAFQAVQSGVYRRLAGT